MIRVTCQICQASQTVLTQNEPILCDSCGMPLPLSLAAPHFPVESIPALDIGDVVKISNEEHVWNGEIAIIRNKKHKHYRIEVLGQLLWVPEHWVQKNDIGDFD